MKLVNNGIECKRFLFDYLERYVVCCNTGAICHKYFENFLLLQPATLPFLVAQANGAKSTKLPETVLSALKKLNGNIGQKKYLLGVSINYIISNWA